MNRMILYIFIAALFRTIDTFIDKVLTQKGISRFDYFFYMSVSMLPFAAVMMVLEPVRFSLEFFPVLLLVIAAFLRYYQQHAVVGMVRKLEPYQYQTYLTMGLILTYLIDCILGTRILNWQSSASVALVLSGVLLIGNFKAEFNTLNKDILVRIFCGIIQGYVTFYILKYWSNAFYIFSLNFVLTVPFIKRYRSEVHRNRPEIIKWVFLQQSFGFIAVYLTNKLMSESVTLGIYVVPAAIVMAFLFSFFKNYSGKRLVFKDVLAIIMVATGIYLLD